MLRQTRQRVGGEDSKFNSFYYYCLIPEITNKVRYMMQQSHQTNYNEYRKKNADAWMNTQFPHFYVMCTYLKGSLVCKIFCRIHKKFRQIIFSLEFFCFFFFFAFEKLWKAILNTLGSHVNYCEKRKPIANRFQSINFGKKSNKLILFIKCLFSMEIIGFLVSFRFEF